VIEAKVLSGEVLLTINNLYNNIINLCDLNPQEHMLSNFVRLRTWKWGKLGGLIPSFAFTGIFSENFLQAGPMLEETRKRKVRSSLVNKGVLYFDNVSHFYLLNLPALVLLWRKVCVNHLVNDSFSRMNDNLQTAVDIFKVKYSHELFLPLKVNEVNMGKIEEMAERGRKRSQDAMKRKKFKRKTKPQPELKPRDVYFLMKDICEEHSVSFIDDWTSKEFRSAKNWLKYCHEGDRDPRDTLTKIIRFWHLFRVNTLQRDDSSFITLKHTPSFTEYYAYRRAIDSFLESSLAHLEERLDQQDPGEEIIVSSVEELFKK
jgi:hypothetical protein